MLARATPTRMNSNPASVPAHYACALLVAPFFMYKSAERTSAFVQLAGDNFGIFAGRMKSTVLLLSILLGILATVQGQNTSNETVSSDEAVSLGVNMVLEFENGKLQHR